jgi:hypothetical protein
VHEHTHWIASHLLSISLLPPKSIQDVNEKERREFPDMKE